MFKNKKLHTLVMLTFTSLSVASCSSGSITHTYSSPIVTGQVLDKNTNQPIDNVSISQFSEGGTTTDQNGYFKLPAYKVSYTISDNGNNLQLMSEGAFLFYEENYRRKYIGNSMLKFLEVKYTDEVPSHVHLGKVYLEPISKGLSINDVAYETVEKMSFCRPNESQKEINCMPLPDGVNNEDS